MHNCKLLQRADIDLNPSKLPHAQKTNTLVGQSNTPATSVYVSRYYLKFTIIRQEALEIYKMQPKFKPIALTKK